MPTRQQSAATYPLVFFMVDSADHRTGKAGLTPTVTLSKNGGAFAAASGAVSEIASGWYKVAANATDTNTIGPLLLHATASGADAADKEYEVSYIDPLSGTLALQAVTVTNANGTAVTLTSSGNDGHGLLCQGNGSGCGARLNSGSDQGDALYIDGSAGDEGIVIQGGQSGCVAVNGNVSGITCVHITPSGTGAAVSAGGVDLVSAVQAFGSK